MNQINRFLQILFGNTSGQHIRLSDIICLKGNIYMHKVIPKMRNEYTCFTTFNTKESNLICTIVNLTTSSFEFHNCNFDCIIAIKILVIFNAFAFTRIWSSTYKLHFSWYIWKIASLTGMELVYCRLNILGWLLLYMYCISYSYTSDKWVLHVTDRKWQHL